MAENKYSKEYLQYKKRMRQHLALAEYHLHLLQQGVESDNTAKLANLVENLEGLYEKGEYFSRWWLEIMVCKYVDIFQLYISQILLRIFIKYPQQLKGLSNTMRGSSDNKVDLSEVIDAGSIDEFIRRYADKKVDELGYAGLPKIIEYFNSKLGLKFDTQMPQFQTAVEFIEVRNIIVHNDGRVSRLFLQRIKTTNLKLEDLYPFDHSFLLGGTKSLMEIVAELDKQIVSKFKLAD